MAGTSLMRRTFIAGCILAVSVLLAAGLSGCGGARPVSEAKKAVKASGTPGGGQAATGDDLGSERYLPREERFRRRQQAILSVLDRFGSAPLTMK
jgi:hypothetical protein